MRRRCGAVTATAPTAPGSVLLGGLLFGHSPADAGVQEAVDVAVEHLLRVADLVIGAQVLDHLVRVQHVRAHLVAPGGVAAGAQSVELGALLLALALQQLGLQHAHGGGLVLDLRLLVLAADHQAGRDVRQAHRRVGGVDRLAARARGAVDVHADLGVRHVDVVGLLDDGQHLNLGEGGLAAALVVEGADAHQAVRALLDGEVAVHVLAVDDECGRLDAGLLRVRDVVDVDLVAVRLRPSGVHAHEHLGPVRRVDAAGAGADVDQGLALVVLAGQHRLDLEGVDGLGNLGQLLVGQLGALTLLLGELVHHRQVLEPGAQVTQSTQLGLHAGELRGDPLGVVRVVPQARVGGLGLELAFPGGQLPGVHDLLDGGHAGLEVLQGL